MGETFTRRLDDLARVPASDVKKRGWRGLMRTLQGGGVLVTNHEQPEAVVLPIDEYAALLERSQQAESRAAAELDTLRQRFDQRLAALSAPGSADRLRSVMRRPAKLGGKVKAGAGS